MPDLPARPDVIVHARSQGAAADASRVVDVLFIEQRGFQDERPVYVISESPRAGDIPRPRRDIAQVLRAYATYLDETAKDLEEGNLS